LRCFSSAASFLALELDGSGANLKGSASGGNGLNDRTDLGAGTLGDIPTKVRKTPRDLPQTGYTQRDMAFRCSQNQSPSGR
jgi:hypothetical protein